FRRGVASFSEVSAALATNTDPTLGSNLRRGAGVIGEVSLSNVSGELRQSNEPLDLAIDGPGFFEVLRADGTPAYTRAGKLHVNQDGLLAAADGSVLSAQIQIPSDAQQIHIEADGRVSVLVADDDTPVEVGRIELATFANPAALKAAGGGLYVADSDTGDAQVAAPGEQGTGTLRQGFVEASNVQMADELVSMMLAQRSFELNARVVQAADQMLSITNSLYR
ncbi:MAG TPA: flagellar hook-basal body complex protein, partial [Steroidobacteraceae bacterium]|nr:flagellar hook-basal body complex protein [Steroidobacteraceae bacterium]